MFAGKLMKCCMNILVGRYSKMQFVNTPQVAGLNGGLMIDTFKGREGERLIDDPPN